MSRNSVLTVSVTVTKSVWCSQPMKKKLEDVSKKLELLYDSLRDRSVRN